MKQFDQREVREAIAHAKSGGQALHVFAAINGMPAPNCFCKSPNWAHLFDQDEDRLRNTAKQLGIKRIFVHQPGTEKQHIDICGKVLQRAIEVAGGGCQKQEDKGDRDHARTQ